MYTSAKPKCSGGEAISGGSGEFVAAPAGSGGVGKSRHFQRPHENARLLLSMLGFPADPQELVW
jgi:hypothetical protein